jgi:copper resistance protein D
MDDPFVWVRAIHFAATMSVSGVVIFLALVAEPAFAVNGCNKHVAATFRSRLIRSAWVVLAVALISGAAWLVFVAAQMLDVPVTEALSAGPLWSVITETGFGHAWTARLVLAGLLATYLGLQRSACPAGSYWRFAGIGLAAALVGTLAWAGHAAAGTGIAGTIHLAGDILHVIAAAAWLGALAPLAVLLGIAAAAVDDGSVAAGCEAVLRFSTLGVVSVTTLAATGIVNTVMLVDKAAALLGTPYGRFLLLKIVLFLAMLAIAAINRLVLTPRLIQAAAGEAKRPILQLRNNALAEAAIGVLILSIVGMLGTLSPGSEQ